jgi:hypothetical protein
MGEKMYHAQHTRVHTFVKVVDQFVDAIGTAVLGSAFGTLSWPLTLIGMADIIDGPWAMAISK